MKSTFTILAFVFSVSLFGQMGMITGIVADDKEAGLEFANVILVNSKDSSMVKAGISDASGKFELENIPSGNYKIRVELLGYEGVFFNSFPYESGAKKDLGTLSLKPLTNVTSTADVVFRKPLVEVKADKTIFNVEGTLNATGLNALEVLKKAPGVMVDNNNNISVKGRSGIIVYIDGKLTPLDSDALAAMLKNMQSSSIESIEIITNPSAKYDAAGSAGIINIKLKKNTSIGTNGSLQLGYGVMIYSKYNSSITLNHRNQKWNFFGTYGNNWGKNRNWMDFKREQAGNLYDQRTAQISDDFNHNFKAGADYYLNEKNTIGVSVNGNLSKNSFKSTSSTGITLGSSEFVNQTLVANNSMTGDRNNINANVNYHFTDTTGTDFKLDLDYGQYDLYTSTFQPNTYSFPGQDISDSIINYRNNTPVNIAIGSIKGDHERQLFKGTFGAGFKSSYVKTNNTLNFFNVLPQAEILDSIRSNDFVYTENINAVYLNYNKQIKKVNLQTGLRAEQTNSRGTLTSFVNLSNESGRDVKREYINLFPSAALTYNLNDTNQFSLTYSRRINRPNYQDLNPFEYKLDELSYQRGNPFLQPQYANVLELTHTYFYAVNTSLTYSYTRDFFTEVTDTTEINRNFISTQNLGFQDWIGLNISAPIPINKWWNAFVNLNGGRLHNKADFKDGRTIDVEVWSYNLFAQNTFTLPKNLSFELSGWFSGPGVWGGTFVFRPMGSIDMALKKDFMDGRASLRVALGDILYSNQWRATSKFGGLNMTGGGGWESRQLRVNFTYNFGNQKLKMREHKSGADDLKDRVK